MRDALDVHGRPIKTGMIVRSVTDIKTKVIFGVVRGEIVDGDGTTEYDYQKKREERIVRVRVLQIDASAKPAPPEIGDTCWAIDYHLEILNVPHICPSNSLVDVFDSCMGGD